MKKIIREYIKIIATSITGLVFVVAAFYLVLNYYHGEEVKNKIYISENEINYKNYKEKLEKINANLNEYKKNGSSEYDSMYNHLYTCYHVMGSEGTLSSIKPNSFFGAYDVFKLGGKFQSEILNTCWALHLSYIKEDKNMFQEVAPFVINNVKTISTQTNYAMEELQNNSSYFYSTKITSLTIRNYLRSDYTAIVNSYNDFADIIILLSNMINRRG